MESDVSVIGLGPMGSALASALLRGGHRVTVWNRTGAKAEPLVRDGAVRAASAAAAVGASPVVVVCVAGYAAAQRILAADDVAPALAGRVLVQLSTGTPKQARDSEAWAKARGAEYLDGAILAFPSLIGTPEAGIQTSGAESAFRRAEPLLKSLGGNVVYLGEGAGLACALDLATLTFLIASTLGFVHCARIYESEGLPVASFGSMLGEIAPAVGEMLKHQGEAIQAGDYGRPQSALATYAGDLETIAEQAREAGINAEFPTFALGLFRRALAAGYGEEEVASLIKVLREDGHTGVHS